MKGADEPRRVAVVRTALEAVYAFTHFLAPVMPKAAQSIFDMLSTGPVSSFNLRDDFYNLAPGAVVGLGEILFQKIEAPEAAVPSGGAPSAPIKAGSKGKGPAAVAKVEEVVHAVDFTKLELRVGQIGKVWHHETAEHLYCEEVDVGAEAGGVRQVASGLRAHYSLEQMQGRKVIVVCNLDKAKLRGFVSYGMVLAAKVKGEDGVERVELVSPPEDSVVGERVFLAEHETLPAFSTAQTKKLKVWEAVAADLRTDSSCTVCWKGLSLLTSAGPCVVSSLSDAVVS